MSPFFTKLPEDKSPLHRSALRLQDMKPGRRIICFNLKYGELSECGHTVIGRPKARHLHAAIVLKITLRDNETGVCTDHYTSDLGLTPMSPGTWNPVNFVIDSSKRHLLPEAVGYLALDNKSRPWTSDGP